jgi:hypothetical protein
LFFSHRSRFPLLRVYRILLRCDDVPASRLHPLTTAITVVSPVVAPHALSALVLREHVRTATLAFRRLLRLIGVAINLNPRGTELITLAGLAAFACGPFAIPDCAGRSGVLTHGFPR